MNIVCYKPGVQDVSRLIARTRQSGLRIQLVLLDDLHSEAASLCELAGFPLMAPHGDLAVDRDTIILAPGDLLQSDPFLQRQAHDGDIHAYHDFLAGSDAAPAPPAPERTAAARVEKPLTIDHDALAAVYATLSRIEETLDREKLLPWLLALGIKAFGGSGGSLMLLDTQTRELFIASAIGLLPDTIYDTRVALGEGISGRVAANRRPELLVEPLADEDAHSARPRDRDRITSAMCTPLLAGGHLLGVLNVVNDDPVVAYSQMDLLEYERLAARIAGILQRAEGTVNSEESVLRQRINEAMQSLTESTSTPEVELSGWAASLAMALGAQHASIALLRDDGSLLIGEGSRDAETRVLQTDQYAPAWNDVFASGRSVIAKQAAGAGGSQRMTILFMPLGDDTVFGAFSICFRNPQDSHRFQTRANRIVGLLNRRLQEFRTRHLQKARIARLRELTAALGDPSALTAQNGGLAEILQTLTGARCILLIGRDDEITHLTESPTAEAPDARTCRIMLQDATDAGWMVTSDVKTGSDRQALSRLAIPLPDHADLAGILLLDKSPRHALDSAFFTDFDAGLVLNLLKACRGAVATIPKAAPPPTTPPEAPIERMIPEDAGQPGDLHDTLLSEISRATRYHVVFSLSAIHLPDEQDPSRLGTIVSALSASLRDSDRLFRYSERTILIIAPEEAQSVTRMEKRCIDFLAAALKVPFDRFRIRRCIFPGRQTTPEAMLEHVLKDS